MNGLGGVLGLYFNELLKDQATVLRREIGFLSWLKIRWFDKLKDFRIRTAFFQLTSQRQQKGYVKDKIKIVESEGMMYVYVYAYCAIDEL